MIHPSPNRFRYVGFPLFLALVLCGLLTLGLEKTRAAVSAPAFIYTVTNTNDSGPGSLREAILAANLSLGLDLIDITANGTLVLLNPLPAILDPVTIQGPGAGLFAVDGNKIFPVLDIRSDDVTLADLTVQHGLSANGAGIYATGDLTLNAVTVYSNTALSNGGGLYAIGDLNIQGGVFQDNRSENGVGGGMRAQGITVITGTHFIGNTSRDDGGGAYLLEDLTVTGALFQDNQCNSPSCDGGGLFSFSNTEIYNTRFISNIAQDQAGGMSAPGILVIDGSLFQHNQAVSGTGGGLYAQNIVWIQDTQFLSNTARSYGGGIYAFAVADLAGVRFESNGSAIGAGGGMYAGSSVSITNTLFLRNTARQGGGFAHAVGGANLVNSLFAENVATDTTGMAMLLASPGAAEVLHSTVASLAPAAGSAIEAVAGSAWITNTIVVNHAVGINNAGASVQQDYNLFFGNGTDTQGIVSGGANSLTSDPLFVDPPGDDYHLSESSPAIDAGTNGGLTTDIDGEARPLQDGFDIGFDEANYWPAVFMIYLPVIQK